MTWRILAALALLVGLVLAGRAYTLHQQSIGYQRAVAEYQAVAVQAAHDAARETQRRLDRQKENDDAHAKQLEKLAADAARADLAAGKLRGQVANLLAASKSRHPATEPGGESDSGESPADLLAQLLDWSDFAAGQASQYADNLKAAGINCEAQYDALMGAK